MDKNAKIVFLDEVIEDYQQMKLSLIDCLLSTFLDINKELDDHLKSSVPDKIPKRSIHDIKKKSSMPSYHNS